MMAGCQEETTPGVDSGKPPLDGKAPGAEAGGDGPAAKKDKGPPADGPGKKDGKGPALDKKAPAPDMSASKCQDECSLDDTRTQGGKTQTCKLYSLSQKKSVPVTSGLHDRARLHDKWIRKVHLPNGYLANTRFTDKTYKTISSWHGTGDSAIWTGAYLAAEAIRLKVTGAPDARANVRKLVEAVHLLFKVHGHAGYLARFCAPYGKDKKLDAHYDPTNVDDHKVTYKGASWFWSGNTSRDQYQGVLLGYSLAYDVLTSASHKAMIRQDMVALAQAMMKEHKAVKITVSFYALGKWQKLTVPVKLTHVVMNPTEWQSGGPFVQIGTKAKPTAYEETQMRGFREFFPDFSYLVKQIPIIGLLVPKLPRAGSAIMLANIMRIGMQTTKGVTSHAAQHAAFKAYYNKNINAWLTVMKGYFSSSSLQCWKGYFGHNIDHMPLYNLIRLETDPKLRASLAKDVLEAKFWPVVKNHKNVFFSYIYTSMGPKSSNMTAPIAAATTQLKQFPAPPKAEITRDLTKKYPASTKCKGQSSVAVDVKDRLVEDFIWQREPFKLKITADGKLVFPGSDYLLTYWMARWYGYLKDDSDGVCLKWM